MCALASLGMVFAASTAVAQGAPASQDPVTNPVEISTEDGEKLSKDDPMYWATVRGIQTIQKRGVQKDGRLSITAYGGIIPNNIFERYYPVGIRLSYYVLESLSAELSGSYAFGQRTDLEKYVQDDQGIGADKDGILLGDVQLSHITFGVNYSLMFGKMAWLDDEIDYFDVYVFGGAGVVIKETKGDFGEDPTVSGAVEGALGLGIQYFFNNDFALRLDYRQFIFQKATGGVANPSEFSLGLSYFL